jgi:hypothetical protein
MLSLLDDCTESIDRTAGEEAAFYAALEGSALYASCVELDQSAATFATVKVEFRAPSLLVADRLIAEHEELVSSMTTVFMHGCLPQGPHDASCAQVCSEISRRGACGSVGDLCPLTCGSGAGPGNGHRRMADETIPDELATLRKELHRVTSERDRLKGERDQLAAALDDRDTAIARLTEQMDISSQQRKLTSRAAATSPRPAVASSRRTELAGAEPSLQSHRSPRRREQDVALGRLADMVAVSTADGAIKACAVSPCELDGVCQNGGSCTRGAPEHGAWTFTCSCGVGFGGPQCADAQAGSVAPALDTTTHETLSPGPANPRNCDIAGVFNHLERVTTSEPCRAGCNGGACTGPPDASDEWYPDHEDACNEECGALMHNF